MDQLYIGVDLGGTKIMTGTINQHGEVIGNPIKVPTNAHADTETIINNIYQTIEKTIANLDVPIQRINGIGIGSTGPLDIKEGIILNCPQLPTMHNFPLKKKIEEKFHLPVKVNNDANCLIYGEALFGAGAGRTNVLGFTLGTGIGCGIVLNNKIIDGFRGAAGEIWASPYKKRTIEDYVSSVGITYIYKLISGEEKKSHEIFHLAKKRNPQALQAWREFGEHLAVPISWGVNFLDPEIVILGGSIATARPYFETALKTKLEELICPIPGKFPLIENANLGNYAGFIGAACLVLNP